MAAAAMGKLRSGSPPADGPAGYRAIMKPKHPPVTQAVVPVSAADAPIGPPGENVEDRLDEAIQETFPASDPISTRIEDPANDDWSLRGSP
jgi:hypothetical protein